MDNLTHSLVGVALGEAGLRRRVGPGTTLLLLAASNAPDIDALLQLTGAEDAHLLRRLYTHCIVGIPAVSCVLAWIWSRWKPERDFRTWFLVALLGTCVHVFLDLVNSYGVVLLWPFSRARLELAWVFIIDLALWAMLLAPLALRALKAVRRRPRLVEVIHRISLVLVALWISACAAGRWGSTAVLDRAIAEAGVRADFRYVFPEPLGPHRWRGVAREGDAWHVWLLRPIAATAEHVEVVPTAASDPRVEAVRRSERARRLEWFYKAPAWSIDEDEGVARVIDLRFRSVVLDREGAPFQETFQLP